MTIEKDKVFYKMVLSIMIPMALQSAINFGVNMMDTVMVGQLGEAHISASSLANSFYSLFNYLCLGTIASCGVLVAQYWGAKNIDKIKETFSFAIRIVAYGAVCFALFTVFCPRTIMKFYTSDEDVIPYGIS